MDQNRPWKQTEDKSDRGYHEAIVQDAGFSGKSSVMARLGSWDVIEPAAAPHRRSPKPHTEMGPQPAPPILNYWG
jgi:hypothetical protein